MSDPGRATFPDAIETLLYRGDVDGVVALIEGLEGDERRAASAWFETSGRLFERIRSGRDRFLPGERGILPPARGRYLESRPDYYAWSVHIAWSEVVGAVALLPPVAAARRVALRRVFSRAWPTLTDPEHSEIGRAACRSAMAHRGAEWVRRFTDTLAEDRRAYPEELATVIHELLAEFDLLAPTGPGYVQSWLVETYVACSRRRVDDPPRPTWLEVLRAHRYTPMLLPLTLTVLDRPTGTANVPAVVTLIEEGVVDRTAVLNQLWTCLDPPRAPGVQRTYRDLVATLRVRPGEVAGGLPFLLGVLATSTTGLCAQILPLAVDLVTDPDGLADLTATVVSRPGKGPRTALLAALTTSTLQEKVGRDAVLDALCVLGDTDDLQLAARVDKIVTALAPSSTPRPGAGESSTESEQRLGLWDLEPIASWPTDWRGRPVGLSWTVETIVLDAFSRCGSETPHDRSSADVLAPLLQAGALPPELLLSLCRRLLAMDELVVPALTRLMEELFLVGAMRRVWETAVHLAGLLCVRPRRSATLHGYLSMLTGYVVEAPPGPVPAGVAALAEARGSSKAHLEARRLADALRASHAGGPEGADASVQRAPALWAEGPSRVLVGRVTRVSPMNVDDLRAWVAEMCRDMSAASSAADRPQAGRETIVYADLHLAAVVESAHRHGPQAVQEALNGPSVPRSDWGHAWELSLMVWSGGGLDERRHWAIALHSRTPAEWRILVDHDLDTTIDAIRVGATDWDRRTWVAPSRGLLMQRPVVDGSAGRRVELMLWSESLVRAGRSPVLLSTPEYLDGTLELGTLLHRLELARDAGVGAVDLAVALHRLRPLPSDAPLPARPAAVLVDPWTVAPPGEPETHLDAVDVLWRQLQSGRRDWTWVRALRRHLQHPWGVCDVDVLRCSPLDLEVSDEPTSSGANRSLLRALEYSSAPLGPTVHQALLATVCRHEADRRQTALGDVRGLVAQGRLRPAPAVEAVRRLRERDAPEWTGAPGFRPVLVRLSEALEGLFAQGHLRELWPIGLAVAEDVCSTEPDAHGLVELLDVLTHYVPEVPVPIDPPSSVRACAEAASGDVPAAARRFLAAVRAAATAPSERTDDRARAAS